MAIVDKLIDWLCRKEHRNNIPHIYLMLLSWAVCWRNRHTSASCWHSSWYLIYNERRKHREKVYENIQNLLKLRTSSLKWVFDVPRGFCQTSFVKEKKRTYRWVCRLIIHVYERPFNSWQRLDLVLQLLADVMGFIERCRSIHNNIDFNEVVGTALCGDVGSTKMRRVTSWHTWYARTVSSCTMSSLKVMDLYMRSCRNSCGADFPARNSNWR